MIKSEKVLQDFLSGDSKRILSAVGKVNTSVVTDRAMIEGLYRYLDKMKEDEKKKILKKYNIN